MAEESLTLVPMASSSARPRKTHRRESSGHICTACDQCYRCKVKCSGEKPTCERCRTNKSACTYSTGKPLGKPKGSKNKIQRSKTTISPVITTNISSDPILGSELARSASTKRPSEGQLPPAKRRDSYSKLQTELRPASDGYTSPHLDSSEHHHVDACLPVTLPSHDVVPMISDSAPFYFEEQKPDDPLLQESHSTPPSKADDIFGHAEVGLEFEDLSWFTNSEGIMTSISTSPTADLTTSQLSLHESPAPPVQPPVPPTQNNLAGSTPSFKHGTFTPVPLPCLCDPTALNIIAELQLLQTSLSPLDTALILARRGFSTVSSSLQCPSCLSSSRSLFYACILIIQQVFTCYGTVKVQGPKMLSSTIAKDPVASPHSLVSIGDFEVQDEEGCNSILDAIVKAEMERGKGVLGGLERWAESSGDGSQKAAGLLLRTLRDEIACL